MVRLSLLTLNLSRSHSEAVSNQKNLVANLLRVVDQVRGIQLQISLWRQWNPRYYLEYCMGREELPGEEPPVSAPPPTEARSDIVYIFIIINYIMGNCSSMKDDPGDSIEASKLIIT